jgi:hypothetical protein
MSRISLSRVLSLLICCRVFLAALLALLGVVVDRFLLFEPLEVLAAEFLVSGPCFSALVSILGLVLKVLTGWNYGVRFGGKVRNKLGVVEERENIE